jgi:hypothetical protein
MLHRLLLKITSTIPHAPFCVSQKENYEGSGFATGGNKREVVHKNWYLQHHTVFWNIKMFIAM